MTFPGEGIAPTLAELVGLRASAQRRHPAKQGRHSITGPAASTLRGRGMEYAESREYVAGDDVRHIDWRLTARSGRTHTKLFQAERERLTLLVADTHPALYFGTRTRFKSTQAARAGAVAVWSAIRDGDRVAALRGTTVEPPVPPASGARGALRVLDALVRWYARPPADDHGLPAALESAARLLRPGSRMIVLADAQSIAAIPQDDWPRWAAHHEVIVVMPFDVLEQTPPATNLPFMVGERRVELDLADGAQRQRWQQVFADPIEAAVRTLPGRGVRAYALRADSPSDAWLPVMGRSQSQVA